MAILALSVPLIPSSSAGAMITEGAQGQPVLVRTTTNRRLRVKSTPGTSSLGQGEAGSNGGNATSVFQEIDSLIIYLDNAFDELPLI